MYPLVTIYNHYSVGVQYYPGVAAAFDCPLSLYLLTLVSDVESTWNYHKITPVLPTWPQPLRYVGRFCAGVVDLNVASEMIGFVLEDANSVYIVFRGTQTALEGIADAAAAPVDFKYVPGSGKVHWGFYSMYSSARDTIFKLLKQVSDSNKQIYVAGHSLGGALATLCALDVTVNVNAVTGRVWTKQPILYTYGSPRVGMQEFVTKFNSTIRESWRVVNTYDSVPHLPPSELGYRHVKEEYPIAVAAKVSTSGILINENHYIYSSYYPGLACQCPDFAREFAARNPASLNPPSPIPVYDLKCDKVQPLY